MSNNYELVEFLRNWPPYNKGETAGFSPEKAQRLISDKIAKSVGKGARMPPKRGEREAPVKGRRALNAKDSDPESGKEYETK